MNFIAKALLSISVFFYSVFAAFGLDIPTNISADEITESSASLHWDSVESAFGYHLYYSEEPDFQVINSYKREFITETPLFIADLEPETIYHFIVKSFDDIWNESDFSQESTFTTLSLTWALSENETNQSTEDVILKSDNEFEEIQSELFAKETIEEAIEPEFIEETIELFSAEEFKLSNIDVLAQNYLSLSFTTALENQDYSERVFKVVNKEDEFIQYNIISSKIDENNENTVFLVFDQLLPIDTEFKLTVISILDAQGRNIESGIESFENFIIDNSKLNHVYQEDTDSIVVHNDDGTITVLWFEEEKIEDIEEEIVLEAAEEIIDIVWAGKEIETLPTTWPHHIIMLIFALIFGAMSFVFKFRK